MGAPPWCPKQGFLGDEPLGDYLLGIPQVTGWCSDLLQLEQPSCLCSKARLSEGHNHSLSSVSTTVLRLVDISNTITNKVGQTLP
jgi:hypothetical protein